MQITLARFLYFRDGPFSVGWRAVALVLIFGVGSFFWTDVVLRFSQAIFAGTLPRLQALMHFLNLFVMSYPCLLFSSARYLRLRARIKHPSFAAHLTDLQLTPLRAAQVWAQIVLCGHVRYSFVVCLSSVIGCYLALFRPEFYSILSGGTKLPDQFATLNQTWSYFRYREEGALFLPILFFANVLLWWLLVGYLDVRVLLKPFFRWPPIERRIFRITAWTIMPLPLIVLLWVTTDGLWSSAPLIDEILYAMRWTILIFGALIAWEWWYRRKVEWRRD